MLARIAIEIVLTVIAFFAGYTFWQLQKCQKFLVQVMSHESFLTQFVSRDRLDSASPRIKRWFVERTGNAHISNLNIQNAGYIRAHRRIKLILGAVIVATFIGSYFLGWAYLIVSIVAFYLSGLTSLTPEAESDALEQVTAIAVILARWHADTPTECKEFIQQASALRPLYNAVREAQTNETPPAISSFEH